MDKGSPFSPGSNTKKSLTITIVGFVIAMVLSQITSLAWIAISKDNIASLGTILASLLGLWMGLLSTVFYVSHKCRSGSIIKDFGLRVKLIDIPVGIAVGVFAQFVLVPVLYFPFIKMYPSLGKSLSVPAKSLANLAHGYEFFILSAAVVIGAPIVEELFFRGLLLSSLRQRIGPILSILASAFVFGLAHFEPLQLLGLFSLGIILAFMALKLERIGAGIFAHAAFNASTMIILFLRR